MSDTEPQVKAGRQPADDEEVEEVQEDEEKLKVAGRLPAVKVGGMRIPERKQHQSKDNSTVDIGDCTGLNPEVNINSEVVSGAHVKGNADFTVQATKVAHAEKAPQNVCSKQPIHNIMQPRK